jgi:virginiamycin B lyase
MRKTMLLPLIVVAALLFAIPLARGQNALPDGPGKDEVQGVCVGCHELRTVTNAGYSQAQWQNVVAMMVNVGAKLPPDQLATITDYLAKNFPEKPAPPAIIVPGPVTVAFQEWQVPTPGSRPHDPLATKDGALWYSGQMANVLGRLDPASQAIKEYPIPHAMAGPHGLVDDRDGNIWFTANFAGYIGKLDSKSGEFAEYPLPDPEARDPHTPLFDRRGNLWFTVQSANRVGRLVPATGEIKLLTVPTTKARPYGMVIDSHGVPFFDEFGSNKLGRIDPETMAIEEYVLPDAAARPRRIAITPDDIIWYSDYGRGYLGRLDPRTGKVSEWPSPGGPKSQPYGIAVLGGAIWYSESGVRPNTLVRFDPESERFQSWAIPSGGGVVRNMMPTAEGGLALACSGVNGIALVTIK